jgi:CBS-domain-containing membrane protein
MQRHTSIVDKLKRLWVYYFLQSLLAGVALLVLVLVLGKDRMVAVSAMGATAFIVFAMPTDASAQTRNVIGGHLVGLVSGTIFYFASLPYFVEYPLVVGIAVFLMVALDVEHPPAAGTALAVVISEVYPVDVFVAVMVGAVVLSQCRYYLRHYLKDLV